MATLGAGLFWWQHQEQVRIEAQQQQVAQRTRDAAAAELRRQQIAAEEAKRTQEAAAAETERQRVAAENAKRMQEAAEADKRRQQIAVEEAKRAREAAEEEMRRQQLAADEAKRVKEAADAKRQRNRDDCTANADNQYRIHAAIISCTAVIQSDQETAASLSFAFSTRGSSYYEKGEVDRAIADLDQAIRLDSNNASAFESRAFVYQAKGLVAQAAADLARARQLRPPLSFPPIPLQSR